MPTPYRHLRKGDQIMDRFGHVITTHNGRGNYGWIVWFQSRHCTKTGYITREAAHAEAEEFHCILIDTAWEATPEGIKSRAVIRSDEAAGTTENRARDGQPG
jgi:hypothetical protein